MWLQIHLTIITMLCIDRVTCKMSIKHAIAIPAGQIMRSSLVYGPVRAYSECPNIPECIEIYRECLLDGSDAKECNFRSEKCCLLPPKQRGCGIMHRGGILNEHKNIVEPEIQAEYGEFPWLVSMLNLERQDDGEEFFTYHCGGSLIHPSIVLTGAHCVAKRQPTDLIVEAGFWSFLNSVETLPKQSRDVAEIVIHPDYREGGLLNNVALVVLAEPVNAFQNNIAFVCLPPHGHTFDNQRCLTTGWGKDRLKEIMYRNTPKKVEVPIVAHTDCQTQLRRTRLTEYFQLHNSFVCAGGERDRDSCAGDGGAPLVCPIATMSGRFYQAGIVSWGIGCGKENVPAAYAKVSLFRNWIDAQLTQRNMDTSFYTL